MKFLLIVLLFSSISFPQISLGFAVEGTSMITDKTSRTSPVSGIALVVGYKPLDDFNIEAKLGISPIIQEYTGFEYSIYIDYNITELFFLIGGVGVHDNDGYFTNTGGPTDNKILLIGTGAGIHITKFFAFELLYNFPTEKKNWIVQLHSLGSRDYSIEKLTGVIKANLKFSWSYKYAKKCINTFSFYCFIFSFYQSSII